MFITPETLELENLNELVSFTRDKSGSSSSVTSGFILAKNLLNQKGGILYPEGASLDQQKISRLIKLKDNNPDVSFTLSLKRAPSLLKTLKNWILGDVERMVSSRKVRKEFSRMIERVDEAIKKYSEEIFDKEEVIYTLYQTRFAEQLNSKEGTTPFYNHLIGTFLMVIAIFQQSYKVIHKQFKREEFYLGAKAALMRPIGGCEQITMTEKVTYEELQNRFQEGNKSSPGIAANLGSDPVIIEALKLCCDYDQGNKKVLEEDNLAGDIANIILIAEQFNIMHSGLFGDARSPKEVADKLYILATQKEYKKSYVDVLAKSLTFGDLFDFYYELERLNNACPHGKFGRPYPMTGFKSPVLYLCSESKADCEHFISTSKSVTIFRDTANLKAGSYGRCELLSNSLIKFYEEHYEQIKEDTISRDASGGEDK